MTLLETLLIGNCSLRELQGSLRELQEKTIEAAKQMPRCNPTIQPTRLQLEACIGTLLGDGSLHNQKKILWVEQAEGRIADVPLLIGMICNTRRPRIWNAMTPVDDTQGSFVSTQIASTQTRNQCREEM